MYKIEGYSFVRPAFRTSKEYCRACGRADFILGSDEWSFWKDEDKRHTECLVSIPHKDLAFVSISGQAYPICNRCLRVLRDGETEEREQIMLRLLHPVWQELLPVVKERERIDAELAAVKKAEQRVGQLDKLFEEAHEI